MADDPVSVAASNNPILTTLVAAVSEANLVSTIDGAEEFTVFAPIDDAFGKLDQGTLEALLADDGRAVHGAHAPRGRRPAGPRGPRGGTRPSRAT